MKKNDIRLSSEFKTQTIKAIISIMFFVLIYIVILLLTIGLTVLCIYGGIMLIAIKPTFLTIALGFGLASFGVFILIFLVKFIFKSYRIDYSHLHEIKKLDEPELFILIEKIVNEVGTTFPKKVYLSADVNASVFYDSSFWSMFFPVKKNLQIGLGLINTVTKTELTAILSHEFGHFSQRTMRIGSYVYNVNQVIFNMLYDNEAYEKLVQNWANVNGFFSFFFAFGTRIIKGIQWILRKLYDVVNRNYMALSREMEFHADEIAANLTGFEPLRDSLLRLILADYSFNQVLAFYEGKMIDNIRSSNLYMEQSFVLDLFSRNNNIPIIDDLPNVRLGDINKFNKSKLVIKDQWTSHPSIEERIERLEKTKIVLGHTAPIIANEIFNDITNIQSVLTDKIFEKVQYQGEPELMLSDEFKMKFKEEYLNNTFSDIYNGYYDNKNPLQFEIDTTINSIEGEMHIEEFFSDEKIDLVYTTVGLQADIEIIRQIVDKTIPVKTFDYEGKKYGRKESKALLSKLSIELGQLNEYIKLNDSRIFRFFFKCEQRKNKKNQLEKYYRDFFDFDKEFDRRYKIYTDLFNELQFVNIVTSFDDIRFNFKRIMPLEVRLKSEIEIFINNNLYDNEITKGIRDDLELYVSKEWEYFGIAEYHDQNLGILFTAMNNYVFLLSRGYFLHKKKILNYQEELIKE